MTARRGGASSDEFDPDEKPTTPASQRLDLRLRGAPISPRVQRLAPCERPTTPAPGNASSTEPNVSNVPNVPRPPALPNTSGRKLQRTSSGVRVRVRPEEMPKKNDAPPTTAAPTDAPVFAKTTRELKMPSEAPPSSERAPVLLPPLPPLPSLAPPASPIATMELEGPRPPAPSLSEDVRIEISVPPPPLVEARIDRPTMPSTRKVRRRRTWPLRIALMVIIVGAELALAQRMGLLTLPKNVTEARALFTKPQHSSEPASAPSATTANAASTTTTSDPAAEAPSPSAAPIPAGMGQLDTRNAIPGHRIFVNERTVGETPSTVLVPCGASNVKLGSAGRTRSIEVPCGTTLVLDDE